MHTSAPFDYRRSEIVKMISIFLLFFSSFIASISILLSNIEMIQYRRRFRHQQMLSISFQFLGNLWIMWISTSSHDGGVLVMWKCIQIHLELFFYIDTFILHPFWQSDEKSVNMSTGKSVECSITKWKWRILSSFSIFNFSPSLLYCCYCYVCIIVEFSSELLITPRYNAYVSRLYWLTKFANISKTDNLVLVIKSYRK